MYCSRPRFHFALILALGWTVFAPPTHATPSIYDALLSTDTIGASTFRQKHPDWDGSGVVIAVLDTGVDMGVQGLRSLPNGKPKVMLVRDFSGQGRLELNDAELTEENGVATLRHDDIWVHGFQSLSVPPYDPPHSFRLAVIDESRFKNSKVADLNANGSTTDRFTVVTYHPAAAPTGPLTLIVDTDGDHDISDETPFQSYEIAQQSFTLAGFDPNKRTAPLTFAIYADPDTSELELHFDDGGHGSHCAGIAAGFRLFDRDGFHGIAPGAQVMSLKIGNNDLSGGSTTTGAKRRALEFVVDWAKKNKRPVVVNLSYGIGSEIEGQSAIDRAVNDALIQEPTLVYLSTSAGNSGPGISSIGQPAAAHLAFTAGAVLSPALAEMLYSAKTNATHIFSFSARGGDTNKPTAVLPGVAVSTVPPFMTHDMMNGTSMAAPQGAGAIALLVGAATATQTPIHNGIVTRALRYSAKPLPNYTVLDQGGGLVSISAAWELIQTLASAPEARQVIGYRTETENPLSPSRRGPSAYWRVGHYVPPRAEGQTFSVHPVFSGKATAKQKKEFLGIYTLKSDADWLQPETSTVYLRGENGTDIKVSYDASKLTAPGLYVSRILATATDAPSGARVPSFEFLATVIVPEVMNQQEPASVSWEKIRLEPGEIHRFFAQIPHDTSLLDIDLTLDPKSEGWVRVDVFDPHGREVLLTTNAADTVSGGHAHDQVASPDLEPGVHEFVLYSAVRNKYPIQADLKLTAYHLILDPPSTLVVAPGEAPEASFTVINPSSEVFVGKASGNIDGYTRSQTVEGDSDTLVHTITVSDDTEEVVLTMRIDPFTYVDFTDVSVMVVHTDGTAVQKDGFNQCKTQVRFQPSNQGTYRLEITAARTYDSSDTWSVELEERHILRGRIAATVVEDGETTFRLYPSKRTDLMLQLGDRPKIVPDGYDYSGEIRFVDQPSGKTWLIHPLRLRP